VSRCCGGLLLSPKSSPSQFACVPYFVFSSLALQVAANSRFSLSPVGASVWMTFHRPSGRFQASDIAVGGGGSCAEALANVRVRNTMHLLLKECRCDVAELLGRDLARLPLCRLVT
jgi:hypothetical protein